MSHREEIAQQAMGLSAEDRLYLVEVLEQSLTKADSVSAEIDDSWLEETDRRIASYDRGEVQAADFETALNRMRRHLAEHRHRRAST